MNKILSIIIPTYNMESLLRHTLESLLISDANLQKLEVLVINDGSKDSSLAIAQEYESKYPNTFRAIDKPNGNYGSCINRGLKEATGKYVKVLDADDCFKTDSFDLFLDYLSVVDVDMLVSDFDVVDENWISISHYTYDLPTQKQSFTLNEVPNAMTEWLWHHAITYKRSIFDLFDYHQTEGISYTDDEWIFMPMIKVKNISYFPHVVYLYLRGREGQTFDPKVVKRTLEHRITVVNSMVGFYINNLDEINSSGNTFIINKLIHRLRAVYNYHLIRYQSKINNERIIEFDKQLKDKSLSLYEEIGKIKSNHGWYYIRQWRNWNYSSFSPSLLLMKAKRKLNNLFSNESIIPAIPLYLMRKNNEK